MAKDEIKNLKKVVWARYKKSGRHDLPWRKTHNPYRILVSEVMLQQTQVERVVPFYNRFIKKFPTAKRLASAPLASVLRTWQGLGYNRRAKMLRAAAKAIVLKYDNGFPAVESELIGLPGVGPYTARAVAAFAYNRDGIFIETNIRTAVIHHFFSNRKKVSDAEIEEVLRRALPKGKARKWYAALMDYGAHLKRSGFSHNARSHRYVKQSKFAGSLRQARGALLRALAKGPHTKRELAGLLGDGRTTQMGVALAALVAEGLVAGSRGRFTLAD